MKGIKHTNIIINTATIFDVSSGVNS